MVIRHEYSCPPPSVMPNNSGAMHLSYNHHGAHHMHQPYHQRYYTHHHPPHHPSSRSHHQHSPNNGQSPSHHAAVTLQSMQQHYYSHGYPRSHFQPQHNSMHHGTPMVHSPSSSNQASSQDAVPPNTKSEAPKAEGFNMLIAAATSESMNSIDEEEKVTQQVVVTTAAKGILKHPRGKQLVSPLESEEKAEKEADADVAIEQRDDKEKEETQSSSAGPLKKRRKMEEQSVAADDVIVFLERLHKFLTDESPDVSRAMEWLSHGKGFRVLRWDVLAEKVLPELMNGKEELDADALIHSFKGQLKECGFVEVKRGKDYGSYCLEFFIKDQPDLIKKITPNSSRADLSPNFDITQSGSSLDGGMEWRSTRRVAHSIFKLPHTEDGHQAPGGPEQSHPSYLHMPVLTTTATASFAENWGWDRGEHHHHSRHRHNDMHFPRPYPPHNSPHRTESKEEYSGRSPKTIRFRDDEEAARHHASRAIEISPNDAHEREPGSSKKPLQYDMVQITPNPEYDQVHKQPGFKPHFPVSRRGGRGGVRPVPALKHAHHD
ncbi:hypothetical protein ACHAWO_009970 [Cyclotella atomus]|uniref:HSF-type DNA-binding domain-containing protein n=1 Tax=Cyclotella atomus TaxID=382360 RepID=A0ABD3QI82_9STRA